MEEISSTQPSIVKPSSKPWGIILIVTFLLITFVLLILFFFTSIFSNQKQWILHKINLIPAPINLDNPKILQTGVAYVFRGNITQITPQNNIIQITTDIPNVPPLQINQEVQVYKGPNINSPPTTIQDLAVGKEIGLSVVYDLETKNYFVIRVFIL